MRYAKSVYWTYVRTAAVGEEKSGLSGITGGDIFMPVVAAPGEHEVIAADATMTTMAMMETVTGVRLGRGDRRKVDMGLLYAAEGCTDTRKRRGLAGSVVRWKLTHRRGAPQQRG